MFTQLGMSEMRKLEPLPLEFERPEAFDKLVELHRSKLGFSEDEMRRILLTDKFGELSLPLVPQMRIAGLFDDTGT